jgi:hypothetical protein
MMRSHHRSTRSNRPCLRNQYGDSPYYRTCVSIVLPVVLRSANFLNILEEQQSIMLTRNIETPSFASHLKLPSFNILL